MPLPCWIGVWEGQMAGIGGQWERPHLTGRLSKAGLESNQSISPPATLQGLGAVNTMWNVSGTPESSVRARAWSLSGLHPLTAPAVLRTSEHPCPRDAPA